MTTFCHMNKLPPLLRNNPHGTPPVGDACHRRGRNSANTATNATTSIIKKKQHTHTHVHSRTHKFLHQMSNVPVNTRHQLPHNPNLISHLVHINNPPSRSRGQLRQNHSAFLPPLVHPLIYIRRLKNSGVLRSLGRRKKRKQKKNAAL